MQEQEEWRPINGVADFYRISNLGRVKSLERTVSMVNRWGNLMEVRRPERVLKPRYSTKGGYPIVNLYTDPSTHSFLTKAIHVMVCEAFIGPRPEGMAACHRDGNPRNCRLDNLAWQTYVQNSYDRLRHGTFIRGSSHGGSKLTERDVIAIRAIKGMTHGEIAKLYGLSVMTIGGIIRRNTWRHVP